MLFALDTLETHQIPKWAKPFLRSSKIERPQKLPPPWRSEVLDFARRRFFATRRPHTDFVFLHQSIRTLAWTNIVVRSMKRTTPDDIRAPRREKRGLDP